MLKIKDINILFSQGIVPEEFIFTAPAYLNNLLKREDDNREDENKKSVLLLDDRETSDNTTRE